MAEIWELVRVDPPRRGGERILLEPRKSVYVVGRSRRCDIRLFSPTASREHAEMKLFEGNSWHVVPKPSKEVLADGDPIDGPCELCEGLSLVMGSDRLRCQTPAPVKSVGESAGVTRVADDARGSRVGLAVVFGMLAFALLVLTLWRLTEA